MKLTSYGFREWFTATIIACAGLVGALLVGALLSMVGGLIVAAFFCLFWIGAAGFFRDPHRIVPDDPSLILSPADGVVRDIEIVDFPGGTEHEKVKAIRIGIFLSVLNVHLNRAPCDFLIEHKHYKEGQFHDARSEKASTENESMTLAGQGSAGGETFLLAVRQISGAIARRIVCPVEPGDKLVKGERYGMIKFGSRTELYFASDAKLDLVAQIGDKVSAGVSIMAKVKSGN